MKEFRTESKRMLELMIGSIYTNKEIFLRELISNASDALDKLHFISLTTPGLPKEYRIEISIDKAARTLTISDNGIGMSEEELDRNLGTIAQSGTYGIKSEAKSDVATDDKSKKKSSRSKADPTPDTLIGQFGVGFYSTFMVAKRVEVISRRYDAAGAYRWTSDGTSGYEIAPCEKNSFGTTVILTLRDNDKDEKYDNLLQDSHISSLVSKYSDYIRYPIVMGDKTLNSMVPIWRKAKKDIKKDDYTEFYKASFRDFLPPLKVISSSIEGSVNYNMLVFLPSKAPFDYYSKDFEKGLSLYSNSVLIMQRCGDILPDYLGFVKGVVDSSDISLNISREILQQDRQLRAIAASLEKKLLSELGKMLKNEREDYEKLFTEFGVSLKYGAYDGFGANKDKLKDLLLFYTSKEGKYATLAEYIERLIDGQDSIYYVVGASVDAAKRMPQAAAVIDKGYEVLVLTSPVDEFLIKTLVEYDGKKFVSVTAKDILPQSDEDVETIKKATEDDADLLKAVKENLKNDISDVVFSKSMGSFAVVLRNDGEVSVEMERILAAMPGAMPFKAPKVLELNPSHPMITKLKDYRDLDSSTFGELCRVLLCQAKLVVGIPIDDTVSFVESMNKLLVG